MFDKIVERLYSEIDSARSIATSGAGVGGLLIYLMQRDWVIAAFSAVIVFPSPALRQRRSTSTFIEPKSAEQSEKRRRRSTTNWVSTRKLSCKPLSWQAGRCLRGHMSMLLICEDPQSNR